MALFQIGPFDFISLSRPPSREKARTEREVRPGVRGVTLWGVGSRTETFECVSVRDVNSVDEGLASLEGYETIVGTGPVGLIYAGRAYSEVFVHDVMPLDEGIHATLLGIGGVLGTSHGMCRCVWLLEFVPSGQ